MPAAPVASMVLVSEETVDLCGEAVADISCPAEWDFVQCPITKPLTIHMHGGASKYWFAATVENANRRTKGMEVSTDGGSTWQTAVRTGGNNMFELKGTLSSDTADIRVTSHVGTQVTVKNVALSSGKETAGTANYA